MSSFDYTKAFSRNLGWITSSESEVLKSKTVAIAGVGGVGGQYCEVLARLGIEKFHLADPDAFEQVNFNRQNGSGMSSVGRKKLDVLNERILDINPNAQIKLFYDGVKKDNIQEFISGIDLYVDGLDFFVLNERLCIFQALRNSGIPGITIAPMGMGAALLVFTKDSMDFENYFGINESQSLTEKALRFLLGVSPTLMQRHYQADRSRVDLEQKRVPSTPCGVYLCAGVAGTLAVKILLNRGPLNVAPWSLHYDAYLQTYKKRYVWGGFANPLQKIKLYFLRRMLLKGASADNKKAVAT